MGLHEVLQRLDTGDPEGILIAQYERRGPLDEEYPTECPFADALGLESGFPDGRTEELGTVGLDDVTAGEEPDRSKQVAEEPRDGGLPGSRVPDEEEVRQRDIAPQSGLLSPNGQILRRNDGADRLLCARDPDEGIDLPEDLCSASTSR